MSNPDNSVKIELGASAKINFDVKTEIPKESSGRFLDALTELIRPFSERRGLAADRLRLEREQVLYEIARRVRARLELENKPIRGLANKVLIPFFEKASLEDSNDEVLIEMWANLLATAMTGDVTLLPQYIEILSQLSGSQATLLEKIITKGTEVDLYKTADHFHDSYDYLNQTGLPGALKQLSVDSQSAEEFGGELFRELNILGVAIEVLDVWSTEHEDDEFSISSPDGIFSDAAFFDFAMLERLGLLRKGEVKGERIGKFEIFLHYYIVTPIGCDLFACCNPSKLQRSMAHKFLEP
jgi:hypothetical protein